VDSSSARVDTRTMLLPLILAIHAPGGEHDLIERLQRRDPQAMAELYDRYGRVVYSLILRIVRDGGIAEDLVQETFLAALKARDCFAGRSSDRTWLVGILRHKIYDHLRRVCRERSAHTYNQSARPDQEAWDDSVLWAHEVAGECLQPSRRMELAELRQALEMAVGKLPPRIAQVFQLYEVEERPNREVCEQLKISESNLWVMLHRARKQLRDELAGWCGGQSRRDSLN